MAVLKRSSVRFVHIRYRLLNGRLEHQVDVPFFRQNPFFPPFLSWEFPGTTGDFQGGVFKQIPPFCFLDEDETRCLRRVVQFGLDALNHVRCFGTVTSGAQERTLADPLFDFALGGDDRRVARTAEEITDL